MANALITPTIIAQEALFQLENNLQMANQVHREYREEFVKVGTSVNIRKPVKFQTSDGATLVKQDVEEANTSIVVTSQKHVGWEFSSLDLTMTIEEYSERYITPAMITLAQTVDKEGLGLFDQVWSSVSLAAFAKPKTFEDFAILGIRMDEHAIPPSGANNRDRRRFIGKSNTTHAMAGGQAALLQERLVKEAWVRGRVNMVDDIDIYMDQNVVSHTVGTTSGTPLVAGAAQNVTYAASKQTDSQNLLTDGWTASQSPIIKAGDVITLAGVNAVNPVPGEGAKQDLGYLQQFTLLADANSDGGGLATLSITPAIISVSTSPYQRVSAAPADNAAIVILGTAAVSYAQHLGFHRNAFALVTVPLIMPLGAVFKARATHKGLSIRVIRAYDIATDQEIIRLDILYGWKAIYPELAIRFWTTV